LKGDHSTLDLLSVLNRSIYGFLVAEENELGSTDILFGENRRTEQTSHNNRLETDLRARSLRSLASSAQPQR
jgi:hypothetical protein